MDHHPWSLGGHDSTDSGLGDAYSSLDHSAGLEHGGSPPHGTIPHGDTVTAGPPAVEVRVEQVSFVADHDLRVEPAGHDPQFHHDLLSLAKDTGWLSPTSPPMLVAGTVIAGVAAPHIKRLTGARTSELEQRLAGGERVVVAVDADELERSSGRGDRLSDAPRIPGQGVERAVEVVEIDAAGPNGSAVVIDDAAHPERRRSLPLSAFEAAWEQSRRLAFTDGGRAGGSR
jgi:hypothetical protein